MDKERDSGSGRAGVMATGMGGTNAHVVLEEAPALAPRTDSPGPHLLVLSAKTPTALDALSRNLADFLAPAAPQPPAAVSLAAGTTLPAEADVARQFMSQGSPPCLADVAYTLQTGRKQFSCRRFVVCRQIPDAVAALRTPEATKLNSGSLSPGPRRPVVFLLPGIGDHYVGMGQELYERFSAFRQALDRCALILQPLLNGDIREILYPPNRVRKPLGQARGIDLKRMLGRAPQEAPDPAAQQLDQTIYTHPALFSVEYALAQLWLDWGVQPDRLVGHSMGEYVAACLAGVLSLEDALRLIALRAQLVNDLPLGAMLAVMLPEDQLRPLLREELSISLINGPNLCVVAGPVAAMADFQSQLTEREILFRPVRNAHAFHSRMLDPIIDPFTREVERVHLQAPRLPFISNVTGTWITAEQAVDPHYWAEHARRTARFSDALEQMWQLPGCLPLEIGPGRTLGVLAMQHPARPRAAQPLALSSLRQNYENQPDVEFILNSLGRLWLAGTEINWEKLEPPPGRRKLPLPSYPFERQRHGIKPETDSDSSACESPGTEPARKNGALVETPSFHQSPESGTQTEMAVEKIWSEVLGLKQIGRHDNFFDIGGHSLPAMQVIAKIRESFGQQIPLSSLFTAPTISQLSSLLDGTATGAAATSAGLRGKGTGAPLFYIPQIHGFGFLPKELAGHLSEDCRYFDGLQYPGLKEGEPLPRSLEEIAAYLIPQIRKIWPNGPYYLLGWSFGGAMAFEVARQMEAQGIKVQLVLLLDSRAPGPTRQRKVPMSETIRRLRQHWSQLSGTERVLLFRRLAVNKLRFFSRSIRRNLGDEPAGSMTPIMVASRQAGHKYRPGHYHGKVVLFQIEEWEFFSGLRYATDPTFGWSQLVRGHLEIVRVPGDHMTMILEPAVSKVAAAILDSLKHNGN